MRVRYITDTYAFDHDHIGIAPVAEVLAEGPSSSAVFTFLGPRSTKTLSLAGIESDILCEFSGEEDDQPQRSAP